MQPDQGEQAAVQLASEGRQELPVHQDRHVGGLSASLRNAGPDRRRLPLFRPLRQRLQRSQDPGAAQEALPIPLMHQDDHGDGRTALPRLPHQQVRRAVHRRGGQGGVRGGHRPRDAVPEGPDRQGCEAGCAPDGGGGGTPGVRAGRRAAGPVQGHREGERRSEGAAPEPREHRRDRPVDRGRRGVGRGLLHQGGEAGRARQLHHGEPRGGRAGGGDHGVRRTVLQRQSLRAAPHPDAARHGGDGGAGVMAGTEAPGQGQGVRPTARREAEARGDGG